MIILRKEQAVFVGVPRAGSMAVSRWLESLRPPSYGLEAAEKLHDYHASLPEAMEVTTQPLYSYWSFAFVRNPYERLVSNCAMFDDKFHQDPQASLLRSLEAPVTRWTMLQHDLLDGVKTIYRFEDIDNAVFGIANRLVITMPFKKENESSHLHYRSYYTPELRELADMRYATDLLVYNYGF